MPPVPFLSTFRDNKTMETTQLEKRIISTFERFDPLRIILFGSHAAGNADQESDVDVIIVYRTQKKFLDRLKELYVSWDILRPVDILAYTPEEFEQMMEESQFLPEAVSKGKTIYERTGARSS
jgi:predicted nucleotidyltransferase